MVSKNMLQLPLIIVCSGTKDYIVSVSDTENGPWHTIQNGTFEDPRLEEPYKNAEGAETFQIDPVMARYVKYDCVTHYGYRCALQYIAVY